MSILRLLMPLFLVVSISGEVLPAAEPTPDGAVGACMACHREGAASHVRDLGQSTHARFGISCTSCHLAGGGTPRPATVHAGDPADACTRDRQTVMEICQRCHQDVVQAFRDSPHDRHPGDATSKPGCVDCHSSAGGHVLPDDSIAPRCAGCHGSGAIAENPEITSRAPLLVDLLRRVTLARSLVNDRLHSAERLGKDVAPLLDETQRANASFRDIPFEWHRFNLTEVESRSAGALEALESVHARLAGLLADTRLAAAPSAPEARGREAAPLAPVRGQPLRFAVSTMLGPVETYESYVGLFNDLARALDRSYQFVQRRTYQEINELLLRGELDLAFICSGAFVALPGDGPIEIVALPVVKGKSVYHSLIIVRENSPVRRFEDLQGARFAFTDPLSNTGYLYPVFRLAELKTDAARFFSSTMFSGSHDRSILAVYRKLVDAAAVDDLVYNQMVVPQSPYSGRLRVVESSPDFAIPPVVASTSVPAELRARMREFLLGLEHTEKGRQRLAACGFDGFTAAKEENYASIRRMLEVTTAQARQPAR